MLFAQESDYAMRIVRALKDGEKRKLKEISQMEDIPEAFGYKISKKLEKAGIIEIKRGASGGYTLKTPLDALTLYDIIVAIEPDFEIRACVNASCSRNTAHHPCHVHEEIMDIQREVEKLLQKKSMEEIFREEKEKEN